MQTKLARSIVSTLLGMGLMATVGCAGAEYGSPPPYPPYPPQYARPGWDAPPEEMRDFQRRGYADGVQGAQRDFENHRVWNVNNRDEFRHPDVPRNVRGDYRYGFKRGYYATVQHYQGNRW